MQQAGAWNSCTTLSRQWRPIAACRSRSSSAGSSRAPWERPTVCVPAMRRPATDQELDTLGYDELLTRDSTFFSSPRCERGAVAATDSGSASNDAAGN